MPDPDRHHPKPKEFFNSLWERLTADEKLKNRISVPPSNNDFEMMKLAADSLRMAKLALGEKVTLTVLEEHKMFENFKTNDRQKMWKRFSQFYQSEINNFKLRPPRGPPAKVGLSLILPIATDNETMAALAQALKEKPKLELNCPCITAINPATNEREQLQRLSASTQQLNELKDNKSINKLICSQLFTLLSIASCNTCNLQSQFATGLISCYKTLFVDSDTFQDKDKFHALNFAPFEQVLILHDIDSLDSVLIRVSPQLYIIQFYDTINIDKFHYEFLTEKIWAKLIATASTTSIKKYYPGFDAQKVKVDTHNSRIACVLNAAILAAHPKIDGFKLPMGPSDEHIEKFQPKYLEQLRLHFTFLLTHARFFDKAIRRPAAFRGYASSPRIWREEREEHMREFKRKEERRKATTKQKGKKPFYIQKSQ